MRLTDAVIVAGVRAATAAWKAPQDTAYYAERWHVSPGALRRRLRRLAAAGLLVRQPGRRYSGLVDTWVVAEPPGEEAT